MEIALYQIDMERDANRVAFANLELLEKFQGSPEINCNIYDKVYEGDVDCSGLEDVFHLFNMEHPLDYGGRSMSVSDVLEVRSGPVEPGFYFCDSFGFQKVDFRPELSGSKLPETIRVVLLEPGKEARITEVDSSLSGLQRAVNGWIEAIDLPGDEDALLVCNEEGKNDGLPLNRAIREPDTVEEMDYGELVSRFRAAEREGHHLTGYVVFTEDSFTKPYSELSRTYEISSNNKAFQSNMGGYSIFASCLDGTDPCIRLEAYMAAEKGGRNGWKIERCYTKEAGREILDVIAGTCIICGNGDARFASLSEEQAQRLAKKFRYPEHFVRLGDEIKAIPYKPKEKTKER